MSNWYEVANPDTPLVQGDIILDCPVLGWKNAEIEWSDDDEGTLTGASVAVRVDLVVMTQACDLANSNVHNVIVCPHFTLSAYKTIWEDWMRSREHNPTRKGWTKHCKDICDGGIWNLSMMNCANSEHIPEALHSETRIVDFHEIYSLPRLFMESFLRKRGEQRLRLLPPYREHLSQAFARFFMRVGLPVPITEDWDI